MASNLLSSTSPQLDPPELAKVPLFPHQKALLRRMIDIEQSPASVYVVDKVKLDAYHTALANGGATANGLQPASGGSGSLGVELGAHQQPRRIQAVEPRLMPQGAPADCYTRIGVLRDPPGSGKSFVVLARLLHDKVTRGQTTNLLVIPANIHRQWITYCKTFAPDLVVCSFTQYSDMARLYADHSVLRLADLVITTSTFYKTIADVMRDVKQKFDRVILDEIDSIQDWVTGDIPTTMLWLVSASFNLEKMGTFMLDGGTPDRCIAACHKEFIDSSISLPPPSSVLHKAFCPYSKMLATGILTSEQLGHMNAMDFSSFKFHYAPRKVASIKELIGAIFTDKSLEIVSLEDAIEQGMYNLTEYDHGMLGKEKVYKIAEKLQEAKAKKNSVTETLRTLSERVNSSSCCPMCVRKYSPQHQKGVFTCCGGGLCMDCIKSPACNTGSHYRCPVCMVKHQKRSIEVQNVDAVGGGSDLMSKDKYAVLRDIIGKAFDKSSADTTRLMIFSDYHGTFDTIRTFLDEEGLAFEELQGSNIPKLNQAIARYRDGECPVLLVDSKQYGAGLNLECTTHLVLLHECDRKREAQIVGRAQRFGRTSTLYIHKLVYPHELAGSN